MKLRNKKTGEIGEPRIQYQEIYIDTENHMTHCYKTLYGVFEEWEVYEEPKEYWYIDENGFVCCKQLALVNNTATKKEIGNYFETREEAEKAVEKLKAWKRLKDKGITIRKLQHNENGGTMYWSCPSKTGISDKQIWLDLDLLFGDEE